ncbi:hypothetical protein [Salinicoccus roseus]|uniref:Glycosyltransferase RgtA/B/C/D-like domain-containing protein n=1 Tax=Salinicoccus roseus TaxID=45670 RepID=A0ABT4YF75_9STAP|nr:hypothetical protein [Salinicoccus roseus]MDB0579467.1 hypothetical protein [Salinicoccus roseus]
MIYLWIVTVIYMLLGNALSTHASDTTYLTVTFICITAILLLFALLVGYTEFFLVIFAGYAARLGLLLVDLYRQDVFQIPHSGTDTENFYATGLLVAEDMSLLGESVYGGVYSHIIGILFNIYGDDRLFVQYLNILLAITAILVVIRIFRVIGVPHRVQFILVGFMCFFPHSLIFSSILLRESVISLLVVLSLYCFIRWFTYKERLAAFMSVVLLLLAASFHSAIIGVLIGYLFGFIFYRHDKQAFRFTVTSVVPFGLFALIMTYILVFPGVVMGLPLFNKFQQVLDNNETLYGAVTASRGDTAYLTGLEVSNLLEVALFSPIKVLYFIASPMPWNVRNLEDAISFFLDGAFYLLMVVMFVRNFGQIRRRPLVAILVLSVLAGWLIFGLGISNAGTALRHRFKFFYIIIIAAGALLSKAYSESPEGARTEIEEIGGDPYEKAHPGGDIVTESAVHKGTGGVHPGERI